MMRQKAFWGSDAHEFNPDRWLREDSATLEKFYMPVRRRESTAFHCGHDHGNDMESTIADTSRKTQFGLGYAACPGINLAKIEMSKVCASIVRDYDIRQVDCNQSWSYSAFFNTLPHDWPVFVKRADT